MELLSFRAVPISGRGCTKERFCNTSTPDVFSTGYAVRNGIAKSR